MKILIFAGGTGTRFWPLSRKKAPKQFQNIQDSISTFELALERVQPVFGWHNIFVSTNEKYISMVKNVVPHISSSNIFGEPEKRDVGPAAGLALVRLRKLGVTEPVAILWADHFMKDVEAFRNILKLGEQIVLKRESKIIFIGETPTYANNNVGWITIGEKKDKKAFEFKDWVYKPDLELCQKLYKAKKSLINTGYFISTIDYMLSLYEKHQPALYKKLLKIEKAMGTSRESEVINKIYPTIEPVHFDHCVPYNVRKSDATVLKAGIGWEDPGTLYALKNYLKPGKENELKGNVYPYKSKDCLIYNEDRNKLLAAVELDGMVIINTKDALLVVHKDHVREVGDMLKTFPEKKLKKFM